MDVAAHLELRWLRVRPPPTTLTTRGLIGLLCLYHRALASRQDRRVILRVGLDEVCDCLSDGGLQGQRGPKAFPPPRSESSGNLGTSHPASCMAK